MELSAQRVGTGLKVTCIADDSFSESNIQLLVGTRGRLVQVWNVDPKGQMHSVFSIQLDNTVPKAVAFNESSENILVFGLYDGDV